ncbi:MAG: GNAT family protein [Methanoregulaceae archaeon]
MRAVTSSCVLRDWSADDAPAIARHANNPRIACHLRDGFPHPYTLRDAERFITMAKRSRTAFLLAVDVDNEAVGGIGIHLLKDVYRGTAEIGYWLSEEYWGKGIATDAVRTLIPIAFGQFPIIRLQAGIFADNPASMRVLEKCGFSCEAIHKNAIIKNGLIMDEHLYVFLK